MSVSVVQVKPVKPPRRRKYGIFNPSSKRCVQHNMKAHTKTKQIPELPMSGPMRAIHSLAAAPATETATRPLRRRTSAARASRESSRQPQALPDLPSRRAALLALVLAGSTPRPPAAAAAFSLGIPGPKELLREQKKKSARFLLAPIAASREILLKAQSLLASANVGADDVEEVGRMLAAAGRDCVPRQRNSLVSLQSRSGVEVCTFSLILKNAASLLTDKDPLKVEADARLAELIQSFSDLGTVVDNSNIELTSDRIFAKLGNA
ncbi:uncharacterized protein LOC127765393 isoform X1 [Oryza glaberrima]|uniref:uncharacterized protein LOC127765393 isoform X1 n=1 Tax=Oryza glaberrima TaxID=4538 RepID=UPI00224C550F|nr:uncharacterized protein LOC127765393 isoform X1 [Oryza glaberrima]